MWSSSWHDSGGWSQAVSRAHWVSLCWSLVSSHNTTSLLTHSVWSGVALVLISGGSSEWRGLEQAVGQSSGESGYWPGAVLYEWQWWHFSDDDELTSDHDQPLANVGDNIEGGGCGMGLLKEALLEDSHNFHFCNKSIIHWNWYLTSTSELLRFLH